jgi:cell division protein FtsB
MVMRSLDSLARLLRTSWASVGLDHMSTRLGIALLVVSSIFFAANFADKAWVSYQVAQQKQQLLQEIQQTKQQISQASSELKYMHTRPYFVEAARQFDFVRPGDSLVSISTAPAPAAGSDLAGVQPAAKPPAHATSLLRRFLDAVVPGLQ